MKKEILIENIRAYSKSVYSLILMSNEFKQNKLITIEMINGIGVSIEALATIRNTMFWVLQNDYPKESEKFCLICRELKTKCWCGNNK